MTSELPFILSWQNLENLIDLNHSFANPVRIQPETLIVFDKDRSELSLEIHSTTGELPSCLPQELNFRIKTTSEAESLVISCQERDLFRMFYDFFSEVIVVMVDEKLPPNKAVDDAWAKWGRLLERQSVLSKEKQIGLIGELWTLSRMAETMGWLTALDAWHQEANSEHDFCLSDKDIEVKTTAAEDRTHIIGSLSQLRPSVDRELFLLSIHLTPAPLHADGVFSLATIVDSVNQALKKSSVKKDRLEHRLAKAGWKNTHTRFYSATFLMRSTPRLVVVDEHCPKLTPDLLTGINQERISSVSYRMNVSGLGCEDGTNEFLKVLPCR